MKEIKVEWCVNFIKAFYKKHNCTGVYTKVLFEEAQKAGLYTKGTYGSSFSKALHIVTDVECVSCNGEFAYHIFRLKPIYFKSNISEEVISHYRGMYGLWTIEEINEME